LNPELYNRICLGIATDLYALEDQLVIGDETSSTKWLSDIWNEVKDFFELEKWVGLPNVADWVPRFWTYVDHSRGRECGRYLTPKAIHFARIIDNMSTT